MRTIIELKADELERLAAICKRDGISRAEAIRRAVSEFTRSRAPTASSEAFGIWSSRAVDGLEYQEALRKEWDVDLPGRLR